MLGRDDVDLIRENGRVLPEQQRVERLSNDLGRRPCDKDEDLSILLREKNPSLTHRAPVARP